jgi:hypothetical protein
VELSSWQLLEKETTNGRFRSDEPDAVQHVNVNEGGQSVVGNINQSKSTDGKTS